MSRFRAAPGPAAIARALPAPEEALVRDLVATAGADLPRALAALSAALAEVVASRCAGEAQPLVLAGCGHFIAAQAVLRVQGAAGRA